MLQHFVVGSSPGHGFPLHILGFSYSRAGGGQWNMLQSTLGRWAGPPACQSPDAMDRSALPVATSYNGYNAICWRQRPIQGSETDSTTLDTKPRSGGGCCNGDVVN